MKSVYVKPSDIYLECLSKGHKPILVRATFNLLYFYCKECSCTYRVHVRLIEKFKGYIMQE